MARIYCVSETRTYWKDLTVQSIAAADSQVHSRPLRRSNSPEDQTSMSIKSLVKPFLMSLIFGYCSFHLPFAKS